MKRTLLVLALVVAASTASAQSTVRAPSMGGTAATPPASGANVQSPPASAAGIRTPATNTSPSATVPDMANVPANAQGSDKARTRIEADGYKNVQGLARNRDGSWSGKALRGGAMVDVQVDARGNVMSR